MKERGITLVELLVSLAVLGMILAAVSGIMILQHRSYGIESDVVIAQQTARRVMRTLEDLISMAGYGVDPPVVFDFSYYCCQSGPGGEAGYINPNTCSGASPYPACRDRTDDSDEIVFLFREPDPMGWGETQNIIVDAATGSLLSSTIWFPDLNVANVEPGTILMFTCKNSAGMYNYAVVGTVAPVDPNTINITPSTTRVLTNVTHTGEGNFIDRAVVPFSHSCFSTYGAWVFPVRLVRLHIKWVDTDGDGAREITDSPFLMLDNGIEEFPLAQDVEDIQFAYIMANGNVIGGTPGTQEAPNPDDYTNCGDYATDLFDGRKYYLMPLNDPCRMNTHSMNIRAVRVTMVVRTPLPDPEIIGRDKPSLGNPVENRQGMSLVERQNYPYRRVVLSTTIYVPNMLSTAQFSVLSSAQ